MLNSLDCRPLNALVIQVIDNVVRMLLLSFKPNTAEPVVLCIKLSHRFTCGVSQVAH